MKPSDIIKAQLMDAQDMERTLARLARQVIEELHPNDSSAAIIGMHRRGVYLARRLQTLINDFEDIEIPVGTLDVTMYRDDLHRISRKVQMRSTNIPFDVTNRHLILVDDVLCTGRTVRAAMDAVTDFGRPARIQFLTLVDRGHYELPIRADMVGRVVPTIPGEEVRVQFNEIDDREGVWLVTRGSR
ncbi:MAG: bifunctional pyr operon transcriptional regulator/uracil phosphoribosyltransferase PyrR [Bacteroidetes bacterium]|nr:bifunctional pyr operon transcriptional regulator/uracil phosphoribosyltransferase PyrR [Bacteroidota bacterium]MDE2673116.1 bifunctional pyr operon transcriptional regulator/uracil phosphoribosyltransferase PyrR [Bacteroidota bacterium]MXZ04049.1 bifunctional pyr operon transcriptional regulator/uracil phosphoribosyltransferase PyrR [Rhodothermaceae bacterium]MYF40644.1 bifunctional pyr operon transcriptional regulator/uracil phosphoribosyltransferase PyrR [Rhodothermaceae bacterium]